MKLSLEQKSYLQSIDSKKKRKKQKKAFKFLNETIENLFGEIDITHKTRYFLADGTNKTEIEPTIDFGEFFNNVFKNDEVEEEKKPKVESSLAKEQLRNLTSPKEKQQGAFAIGNKPYNQDDIDKICNKEPISAIEKSKEYARQKAEKIRFSLNDMKMCWKKSKKEQFAFTGVNFETFIKSLEK